MAIALPVIITNTTGLPVARNSVSFEGYDPSGVTNLTQNCVVSCAEVVDAIIVVII